MEHGRHGRCGRPWQLHHADSTIPLGVSPPSLPFFLHSPAVSSFGTNPSFPFFPPTFLALSALARPTCRYPCPCLMFACLPTWTSGWPCSLSSELFSLPGQDSNPGLWIEDPLHSAPSHPPVALGSQESFCLSWRTLRCSGTVLSGFLFVAWPGLWTGLHERSTAWG